MNKVSNIVQKYKGITLVIYEDWMTVVWDATGHSFQGPVENDEDVRRTLKIAIDALKEATGGTAL